MGNIKYASHIDLSNHGLTEFPEELFAYRNLKTLNLSNNNIKEIPLGLTKLKCLRNLDLSGNKINQLFAKTFNLPKLHILNLNNNQLRTLPKQVEGLKLLKELHISDNHLQSLPDTFSLLTELTKLNISGNQFNNFPLEILKLAKLKKLWVGGNPFKEIPFEGIYQQLRELKALYTYTETVADSSVAMSTLLLLKRWGNVLSDLKLMNSFTNSNPMSEISKNEKPVGKNIFISYSHKDQPFYHEVEITLKALQNIFPDLMIDPWSDTRIKPGQKWEEEISKAIGIAGIVILITSRNFMASDFIMNKEKPAILNNVKKKGVILLNVVAGKCIADPDLSIFQYVNSPDRPLNSLKDHEQDMVYTLLQEEIKERLEKTG